jgi:glycosyltransferase involved in cell wall biosynthesis
VTDAIRPRVSVVVEGYNEQLTLGTIARTLDGLRQQEFPLDQIEVILVGSAAQAEVWESAHTNATPFFLVKAIASTGAHYYALKNDGVRNASADIIALTDSDACPEPGWLSSIVDGIAGGADVTAGLTLFRSDSGRGPEHPLMQVAASISWGSIVPRARSVRAAHPAGFLSHNVGFRAETLRRHPYRTDLGRTCAGSFLYKALDQAGAVMLLQPSQRVVHGFSLRWWVLRLHRRFGYEVFRLRRLDGTDPKRWLLSVKLIEPVLTMAWHVLLDVPQWLRFSELLRVPLWRRLMLVPVVLGMSLLARGSEMIGMYQTIAAPEAMKRFAESN